MNATGGTTKSKTFFNVPRTGTEKGKIVKALNQIGRGTTAEIAAESKVKPSTVRTTLVRMVDNGEAAQDDLKNYFLVGTSETEGTVGPPFSQRRHVARTHERGEWNLGSAEQAPKPFTYLELYQDDGVVLRFPLGDPEPGDVPLKMCLGKDLNAKLGQTSSSPGKNKNQ